MRKVMEKETGTEKEMKQKLNGNGREMQREQNQRERERNGCKSLKRLVDFKRLRGLEYKK